MEEQITNVNNIDSESKIASFKVKQNMPYEFKVNYARIRAQEFYNECGKRDLGCYVSVGGLDSITLFFFLKSIGIDVPAVSVSSLEDISIQKSHKEMTELSRKASPDSETAAEVRFLFESVRLQFENTARNRPYSSYANKFEEYSRKYLKRRGRSGMMLRLSILFAVKQMNETIV